MLISRSGIFWVCLATLLLGCFLTRFATAEPLDDLRQILAFDRRPRTPEDVYILEVIKAIEGLGGNIRDLRRALLFPEWREDFPRETRHLFPKMRTLIGLRLTAAIHKAASNQDANRRLAGANVITEMGPAIPPLAHFLGIVPIEESTGVVVHRILEPSPAGKAKLKPGDRLTELRGIPINTLADFYRQAAQVTEKQMVRLMVNKAEMILMSGEFPDLEEEGGFARSLTPILIGMVRDPGEDFKKRRGQSLPSQARLFANTGKSKQAIQALRDLTGMTLNEAEEEIGAFLNELGVQQEALRALSNVNPPAREAVDVFEGVLKGKDLGPRRLAADGLKQLVRVVGFLAGRDTGIKPIGKYEVLETAEHVVNAAGTGLKDPDSQVRALCVESIKASALALANLVTEDPKDLRDFAGALTSLKKQMGLLVGTLQDPEPRVRLATLQALEHIDVLWKRLNQPRIKALLEEQGPIRPVAVKAVRSAQGELPNPLEPSLGPALALLKKMVLVEHERDLEVRRRAVEFLELLGESAAPAIPELGKALADPDRFVRWGAVRALGRIAPARAIPELPKIANLLNDQDLSVRIETAETLKIMGPLAHQALPAMVDAVNRGDADGRVRIMEAIGRVGVQKTSPAVLSKLVDQLIKSLGNADVRVRRISAETLGKIGPPARAAIPILRMALGDEDAEVRINASDAILNILKQ